MRDINIRLEYLRRPTASEASTLGVLLLFGVHDANLLRVYLFCGVVSFIGFQKTDKPTIRNARKTRAC